MKIFNLCMLFICLTTYSCQKKELQNVNISSIKKAEMKINEEILKKQILQGANQYFQEAGVEMPKPEFSDEELDQSILLSQTILNNSGYQFTDDNKFASKIKAVFGRTLDMTSNQNVIYVNLFDKCDKKLVKYPNNGVDYQGFYIAKREKLITDFYYLPELIDYIKEYPNTYKIENDIPKQIKDKDGETITIEKWNKLESLSQRRFKNAQIIINRNKYVFDEDKGSFTWLKFNDVQFLESLVKTFGYVKDKDLLSFVLKNNYKKRDELNKILWNKKCNGEIVINKEVFDLAMNWKEEERHDFLMYANLLVDNLKSEFDNNTEFTFSQKAKILGLISYYSTKIGDIDNTYAYSFFPKLSGKNYDTEFSKQNYYNIPDFKEVYEEARTGGVNIDSWVQPDITVNEPREIFNKTIRIYDRADFSSFSKEIESKGEIEYLSKVSGWDYIKINGMTGYLPTQEQKQELSKTEKRKYSFLAEDESEPKKKKGFWDNLFG